MSGSALTIGLVQHFALQLLEQTDRATVDAVVRDVGLPNPLEVDADRKIDLLDEARFIDGAADAAGDIDFAIFAGAKLSVGTALPGYISEHSRTLRDALRDAARFLPLVRPGFDFTVREDGNAAALGCTLSDPRLENYPRHHEALYAGVVGQIRAFTARPFHPDTLSFRHERAPLGRKARATLGCDVSFGRMNTEMLLAVPVLDRPIRGRDDALRALLVEHGELLESHAEEQGLGFAERVELYVQHALPDAMPDADTVARELGVSRRTLGRRLAESGTGFAEIVAQVRLRVASRELKDSRQRIGEIAWRLGYSSQSAFASAFRRATGQTPRDFRASAGQGNATAPRTSRAL